MEMSAGGEGDPGLETEPPENDETEPDTQNGKKTDSPRNPRRVRAKPIDLLKQLDLKQPGTVGEWQMQRRRLVFPQVENASMAIYDRAPEEYTLTAVVQCPSHAAAIVFGIVVGNSQALAVVDGYGKKFSGLGLIQGLPIKDNPTRMPGCFLIDGSPNLIEITVRKNRVQVSCNGRPLVNWSGDPSLLSTTPTPWGGRHGARQLFIGMGQPSSPFVVTKLTLRPLGLVAANEKDSATPAAPISSAAPPNTTASSTGRVEPAKPPVNRFPCRIHERFRSDWSLDGDELVLNSLRHWSKVKFGDSNWGDYDFSVDAMKTAGNEVLVLHFGISDSESFFYGLGAYNNTRHDAGNDRAGKLRYFGRRTASLEKGRWYRAEVKVRGNRCECFLDGEKLFAFTADGTIRGQTALSADRTSYRFRNIVMKAPDGTVLLEGLPDLEQARDPSGR